MTTISPQDRVATAWKALDELERPPGVRMQAWLATCWVLHRLCRYAKYDVIRPTQDHLAQELGVDRYAVRRALDQASDCGLIKREPWDSYGGRWEHTRYHLLFVDLEAYPGIEAKPRADRGRGAPTEASSTVGVGRPRSRGRGTPMDRGRGTPTNTLDTNTTESFGLSHNDDDTAPSSSPSLGGAEEQSRKPNKWGGACVVCGQSVAARAGWLHGFKPVHQDCDLGPEVAAQRREQREREEYESYRQRQEAFRP